MHASTGKIEVEGINFLLFVHDSKKYVIPNWIEVPMETTYDDVVLVSPFGKTKGKPIEQIRTETDDIQVDVPSSTGKGGYKVRRFQGTWTCSCPASMYRRMECKHVKEVKKQYL